VFSVTSLPPSLEEDQAQRMRRYLVSMGIRTACFILAVVALAVLHWTVIGWTLVVGAAVLPYVAVVMANAARSPQSTVLGPVTPNNDTTPQIAPRRPDEEPPR
jgi:predicted anti-sigma-YlaC factor YlaD